MTAFNPNQDSEGQKPEAITWSHRATYTRNKTTGEIQVRLVGPQAEYASGATIPVTRKDGTVKMEELGELVYEGVDDWVADNYQPTGLPMAIYKLKKQQREKKTFLF